MFRGSGQRWRRAAAAGAAGTTLAALGAFAGVASTASAASSDACWATAVNINSCGGMSALVAAAKAEGTINQINRSFLGSFPMDNKFSIGFIEIFQI